MWANLSESFIYYSFTAVSVLGRAAPILKLNILPLVPQGIPSVYPSWFYLKLEEEEVFVRKRCSQRLKCGVLKSCNPSKFYQSLFLVFLFSFLLFFLLFLQTDVVSWFELYMSLYVYTFFSHCSTSHGVRVN